jgi:hypothetical protein
MTPSNRLVSGERLLQLLFDDASRPSPSWLRDQRARRAIPFLKVGQLVMFDPDRVREALNTRFTVDGTR